MDMLSLLQRSFNANASDLHISPQLPPMIRLDGDLQFLSDIPPLDATTTKEFIYSVMNPNQQANFEESHECDFAIDIPNIARFRVNIFLQMTGIAGVFRTIPSVSPTLDQLGCPPIFKKIVGAPNGLILVTGPTGSGKSTTLAAMIDYINMNEASHIITLEDPIEFVHKSKKCLVNQRQIHRDTKDFGSALRSALREDPDVILVGEMRDLETIRLALTAAETGHLVMATLHTSSAPRTINRVVDVFPAGEKEMIRNMLSESLQAVICQTLLQKTNGGRVAAYEIMLGTAAIRNLIRENQIAQMYSVIQTGSAVGMCTLDQYTQSLIEKKIIK